MLKGGGACASSCRIGRNLEVVSGRSSLPVVAWLGMSIFGERVCLKSASRFCKLGVPRHSYSRLPLLSALQVENGGAMEAKTHVYGSELQGFAERVAACNGGMARSSEFIPFKVENHTLGYIHHRLVQHLRQFSKVFLIEGEEDVNRASSRTSRSSNVTLVSSLSSPELRTQAVGGVLESLRDDGLITGWRNELYPVVRSYGEPPFFLMERAAAKHFGIRAYGVHMNGYVNVDGESTCGLLDVVIPNQPTLESWTTSLQPQGISCKENVIKECDEEAGIPRELAEKAVAVGAVSYDEIYGDCYSRDLLFCYDLELPLDFQPYNKDGEVESFMKVPASEVVNIIRDTEEYKPNCALVIIDFFVRHGYITPEQKGYLHLLQSLRSGEI